MDDQIFKATGDRSPSAIGLRSRERGLPMILPLVIVAVIGVGLSFTLFSLVRSGERAGFRAELARRAAVPANALQRDVDDYLHLLQSVGDFFYSSQNVDRHEFQGFTIDALKRLPGLESLEWIPRVSLRERPAHEAAGRAALAAGYQIWQTDERGGPVRSGERPEYYPVFYAEPASRPAALGFDLGVNSDLAMAMARARDTGRPAASLPVKLGTGTNTSIRYRIFGAVHTNLVVRGTVEDRRRNLAGYVAAVIDVNALVAATMGRLIPFDLRGLEWQLIDTARGGATMPVRLGQSPAWEQADDSQRLAGDGFGVEIAGREWRLKFRPSPEHAALRHGWESWGLLVAGLIVTWLVVAFLGSALNRAAVVERLVHERTAELARINGDLLAEIDQRQRMEAALAAEREMIGALMDTIPDHIYFKDRESRFIRINRAMAAQFKLKSPEEALGRSDFDFFTDEHARRAFEDERALMESGGSLLNREEKETWPDGSVTWVSTNKQCLRDRVGTIIGTFGISRDITDRKRAELRLNAQYAVAKILAESESLAAAAPSILEEVGRGLDWAVGVLWRVDRPAGVLRCIECWCEPGAAVPALLEATRAQTLAPEVELPGRVWVGGQAACVPDLTAEGGSDRMAVAAREGLRSALALPIRAGAENLGVMEFFSRRNERPAEELLQSLDAIGSQVGMFMVRRRAEDAVEEKARELARSNKDLEQFAYVASHDLQEPLRMVASYTQMIERRYKDLLDEDGRDFIRFAVDGASRMQTLIQDLLAYSRVGTRTKPFEPVDCNVVLQKALKNLEIAITESGATIDAAPLPTVQGDMTILIQLFQNLIGNGIKFRGSRPAVVHIKAERPASKVPEWVFSFRDEGIGIEPQYFEKIFVIFQRLHTRDEHPGTGIGLAMCKRIVERHGGRIWVESKPGEGATFFFSIPG